MAFLTNELNQPYSQKQTLFSKQNTKRYSRFVGMMKYLLPIIAFVLVSLVFLWPNLNTDNLQFRLGISSFQLGITNDPSMINPRYHGADAKKQPYTITADLAKSANRKASGKDIYLLELERPKADIMMKDGTWLVLTAKSGLFSKRHKTLELRGAVNLFHDSGFEVRTENAQINLQNGTARGLASVYGQGPFGFLNGDGFRLLNKGKTIYFTGKSKLLIHPNLGTSKK